MGRVREERDGSREGGHQHRALEGGCWARACGGGGLESGEGAKHARRSCGQRTGNEGKGRPSCTPQVYARVYEGVYAGVYVADARNEALSVP